MTFEWEDITDEVREKIVLLDWFHSTGFGQGCVIALTEDGKEYFSGFEECSKCVDERKVVEFILGEKVSDDWDASERHPDFSERGMWLMTWDEYNYVYVRNSFFDRFISEFEKQGERRYLSALDTARKLLNPHGKLPLNIDKQREKEIDEILKETERKLEGKTFEDLMKDSISFEDFKKNAEERIRQKKQ